MRKALVIGIDDYPTAPLRGCVNDAHRVAAALRKNGDGSPNFDVRLITDGNYLTRGTVKQHILDLFNGNNDAALLYFSGHGFINSTGGYIVTPDATEYEMGVSMDEILKLANQSNARDKIVILDCCHSGTFGSASFGNETNKLAQLCDGLTVLTASRETESAVEIEGSGIFTSLLVDALEGGAADLRGNITPGSVYAYIDEALSAWEQRPVFKTNVSRFTTLRKVTPPIPFETLRKITSYFSSPESEYNLDPTYEFTEEKIAIPEHVAIMKDLQKFVSVGLVVPVGEEHMYFAAMNSKSCRLTALGYQYWRLANEGKI